jgi:two-component system LytT family sensor kinase
VDWLHCGWLISKSLYYFDMTTSIALKSSERIWIASICLGVALFQATETVVAMRAEGMHHPWVRLFTTLLLSWLPWALATPSVLHLGRQFPPLRRWSAFTWLKHFSVCMGINVLSAAWTAGLEELLNPWAKPLSPEPFAPLWLDKAYNGFFQSVFLYSVILTVSHLLESRDRLVYQRIETARLNEQLANAQLESLLRQIEPHFLFNSLNAIAGLVREGRIDTAVSTIVSLSEFLRKIIEHPNRQEAPLGEEIAYLEKYLDIQKLRFADRLQISVDVPEELFSLQVPSLILQPLVENAVKHGIAKQARGGWIRVAAFCSNDSLTLRVYNDGPNLPRDWDNTQSGVGIVNVRARLQNLYGDKCKFSLHNQNSGVEALLSVPFRKG